MLKRSKIAIFVLLSLNAVICYFPELSAASSSRTGRLAQRRAHREAQAPPQPIKPERRLDLVEGEGAVNKTQSSNTSEKNSTQISQSNGEFNRTDMEGNKDSSSVNNQKPYYYSKNAMQNRLDNQYIAQAEPFPLNRYGGDQANRYASPNDRADYQPNYNPVPMGNWDDRQNWQYYRKEYFAGDTQPEVYRKHHPYGAGGIGYDADPEYLRMQQIEQNYYDHNRGNFRNSRDASNYR